ncbi:hypothetical protein FIBSPDRAFT_969978 [Athelia psychrophila]|uniref:ATP-dependent RNA helicase n=1 Tax=Athelia psychrophila TaxID=1759441 RepID=A0A167T0W4_9AGAM|nr:hypothetical protein FIBSPDRAFT_969978 [Fibularhizoctonia sp. CBS 109695]
MTQFVRSCTGSDCGAGDFAEKRNLKSKGASLVSIATIMGGVSAQKPRRVLDRGVEVLVATPGRLWGILEDDDELANAENIETKFEDLADVAANVAKTKRKRPRQAGCRPSVTKRARPRIRGKKEKGPTTLDDLLLRFDFRDSKPEDMYLYYFLHRYPGRSLAFLSSIDGIRRLMPLAEPLGLKAFPLRWQLEQRQRLKNLDRFESMLNSVLLATDIAARGLDIPAIDHVIHFQYATRTGGQRAMRKTARDRYTGMSIELNMRDKLKARKIGLAWTRRRAIGLIEESRGGGRQSIRLSDTATRRNCQALQLCPKR